MSQIQVVGLDLAKQVFQVHAVAADGSVVVKRQLRRSQVLAFFEKLKPCLVGLRPVAARTSGHARSPGSAIRCG
jgi:transposase